MMTLSKETVKNLRKLHCIAGGFCAAALGSWIQLAGNLGTYLESYLIVRLNFAPESNWFVQTMSGSFMAFGCLMMLPAGYLAKGIGSAWTVFIGGVIVIAARTLCFWAVQYSMVATLLTLGPLNGFGAGFLTTCPYAVVLQHDFSNPGLIYGIITAGQSAVGLLFNYVITAFVNPDNLRPNLDLLNTRYFSQPEILDRVPYVFLVLFVIFLLILPIAVTGMWPPPTRDGATIIQQTNLNTFQSVEYSLMNPKHATDDQNAMDSSPEGGLALTEVKHVDSSTDDEELATKYSSKTEGVTIPQLFSLKEFYYMWLFVLCFATLWVSLLGLYKEMGLTRIPDDEFLATLGSVGGLCMIIARPVWGLVADKIAIKKGMMFQSAAGCILTAFWFWSLLGGRATYFLCTVLIYVIISSDGVYFPLAVKAYFGVEHFMINYGCAYTAAALGSILAPYMTSAVISLFGWPGFTLVSSFIFFTSAVLALLLREDKF